MKEKITTKEDVKNFVDTLTKMMQLKKIEYLKTAINDDMSIFALDDQKVDVSKSMFKNV